MGKIATKYESVGVSEQASVSIDVEAMVRRSMIKLYGVKDNNGNLLDEYDDTYNDYGFPTTDEAGAPSMIRGFIIFETETLSFLFQQVLYMLTPIKTALELPQLLANPKALIEKIKEIIDSIKKLIDDVTTFFTDTKQWFIDTLLGGLADINVPIPDISFKILGVEITLPKIDNKGLLNTSAWEEKLDGRAGELKIKISNLKKELEEIKDMSNGKIKKLKDTLYNSLIETRNQLNAIMYQVVSEYYDLSYSLHGKILEKEKKYTDYYSTNNISYTKVDRTSDITSIGDELLNVTDKEGLRLFNGQISRLIEIPTELTSIITEEIDDLDKLISDKAITLVTTTIDNEIDSIQSSISDKLLELSTPSSDLTSNQDAINNILNLQKGSASTLLNDRKKKVEEDIKKAFDELITLSPATAWIEKMIDLFVNIVKSPIDFIISLITKLLEGVVQFLQELPLPSFEKIKEFLSDILGIANISKMSDTITSLLESLAPSANADLLGNISDVIPDLTVTVGLKFVTSILNPLPIPI